MKGSDVPLRLYTIDLNIKNVNLVKTQNNNFFFRLNTLKSSFVSSVRSKVKALTKKSNSEEYELLHIKVNKISNIYFYFK